MTAKIIDMTGRRYGSVIGLRQVGPSKWRGLLWHFACDCGREFEASGSEVRRGNITRCPACSMDAKRASKTVHGLSGTPEYRNWCAMKTRCLNPRSHAFAEYGGRGIMVCERWKESFGAFLSDMGERPTPEHTVERKNNSGNYDPGNCVWATRSEQANNKRNNRLISIDGSVKTLAEWSRIVGINESSMRKRLSRGVSGKALLERNAA